VGTHEALGLSPCGWIAGFGIPCPTCGMTTSFSLAVRGSLWASFRVQPMGCALAVLTAAAAVTCAYVAATGSRIGHVLGARITPRVLVVGAALALLAWGYKVAAMRGATPFGRCDLP
jgi:sugar phosphate permease